MATVVKRNIRMARKTMNKKQITLLAMTGTLLPAVPSLAGDLAKKQEEMSLRAKLANSEAQIATLQQRVEQLENRLQALITPAMPARHIPAESHADSLSQMSSSPARTSPPASKDSRNASKKGSDASGTFEVDEAAAQRALERTLIQTGALLLPAGTLELTPNFRYTRLETTSPFLTTFTDSRTATSGLVIANQRSRSNNLSVSLDLRAGLPLDSQFELSLPFNHVRTSQVDDFGNATSNNASGIGDLSIGLARTFLREHGVRPDLIGRLTYNAGNGKQQSGIVSFNAGFREIQAEVVALKRQDPLAFTVSAFYSKLYAENSLKPGNGTGITLGATLAASPATSLLFAFSQIYRQKQELNGIKTPGSERTYGVFTLGASSVLSRDVTLVSRFGIGVGNDAPAYSVSIGLPILIR
jgi:hypothetical protein